MPRSNTYVALTCEHFFESTGYPIWQVVLVGEPGQKKPEVKTLAQAAIENGIYPVIDRVTAMNYLHAEPMGAMLYVPLYRIAWRKYLERLAERQAANVRCDGHAS